MHGDGRGRAQRVVDRRVELPLRVRAHRIAAGRRWREPRVLRGRADETGDVVVAADIEIDELDGCGVLAFRLRHRDAVVHGRVVVDVDADRRRLRIGGEVGAGYLLDGLLGRGDRLRLGLA